MSNTHQQIKQKLHAIIEEKISDTANDWTDNVDNATEEMILSLDNDEFATMHDILVHDGRDNAAYRSHSLSKSSAIDFKMDWTKICECVAHEMWPKLSSIIKTIISENNINISTINSESINIIVETLKCRNTAIESIQYLKKLIQRALKFVAVNNQSYVI
eukprot:224768_1